MKTFPTGMENDYERIEKSKLLSSVLFGNRFTADQTLYEYLVEFLLVFSSAKNENYQDGKMKFHEVAEGRKLSYWVEPRMALRRFVFYDKSRKKGTIKADEQAYQKLITILKDKMEDITDEDKTEYIESIQDLFHGYAVVIRNRFWGAQSLLPICPEFMFCDCAPNEKNRKNNVDWDENPLKVDTTFSLDKRNFLARGGEVYYLHVLQGLQDDNDKKVVLEKLLKHLVFDQCSKISKIASFVQQSWEDEMGFDHSELVQQLNLSFIPQDAYSICGKFTVDELINFLSCKMHPINRVELLAKGVMFQILRMMSWRVSDYLGNGRRDWIVDMKGASQALIKKIAAESYSDIESDFMTALNRIARELNVEDENLMTVVQKAKRDSLDIFRAKGKELQCVIPSKGAFERFSLSEDIIRFLVLAIIEPGNKMTFTMFLEKLYEHYGLIIGVNEYKKSCMDNTNKDLTLASCFVENENAFQNFLKETGFLKELSDATSIVVNPYSSILEEEYS